jgi:hypothetical protein
VANTIDSIEYLVQRKFGSAAKQVMIPTSLLSLQPGRHIDLEVAKRVADYRGQLRQLPPEELKLLLDSERKKQRAEFEAKAEREERERFFNQSYVNADFDYWSKAAHWTLDEAIALSFGKAPERVNWEEVRPFVQVSAFAFQYQRRRNLALRALAWEQLYDPVLPGIFLGWAQRTDLDVPSELESAIKARGLQIADWKKLYDDLNANFSKHHKRWMALSDEQGQLIARLQAQTAALEARLASAEAITAAAAPEKSLTSRERNSLLSMVIGMAVGGYRFDPTASRSTQTSEIASDLSMAGVPLDVDTVRKWLRESAELLPPKETE